MYVTALNSGCLQLQISITMDALPADAVKGASSDFSWYVTLRRK